MKLQAGMTAPPFVGATAYHGDVALDDYNNDILFLQFYRFADCPVCNLSLREFVTRFSELTTAGIRPVAVFHSATSSLRQYVRVKEDIPFPIIGDPNKLLFEQYGVEESRLAMLSPAVISKAARAITQGYLPNPLHIEGGQNGLPAGFLIERGVIRVAHYGRHAGDIMTIDQILAAVKLPLPA